MTKKIDLKTPEVVAYQFEGDLSKEEVEEVHEEIRRALSDNDKVRFFADMRNLDDIEPQAILEDLKLTPEYMTEFERFALIGDENWHQWLSKAADKFTKADSRYFSPNDYNQAKEWIRAR